MMRLLFSFWFLLALCMASCTTKNAEDQTKTEEATNSTPSTQLADTSANIVDTPKAVATPDAEAVSEATPAPNVAAAPKAVASVRKSSENRPASPVSPEPAVSASSTSYRPRSTRAGGYLCDSVEFVKYERLHDGEGGFMRGKILASNSKQCGYVAPVVIREPAKESPTPVAVKEPVPAPEQWVADPLLPEKCEDGILYKFEKNAQTGAGRRSKVGVCAVETAKPNYLNKSIQQVKDDGLIKKGESGTRKKDN